MRTTSVSVTGVAASAWLPLDAGTVGTNHGLYFTPGSGATVTVQVTPDDVFDPTVTPTAYAIPVAALVAATTAQAAALPLGAKAIRMNQTVGVSTSTLKVVTQGIR